MAAAYRSGALEHIRSLFEEGTCAGLSDDRLLERFVTRGDEAVFAALVERHGPLVRNTCQAVLRDPNAAADAFQATFVLLFRKAGSIRGGDALGAWLHRVANRTALQARSDSARRRQVEKAARLARADEPAGQDDLAATLHEEIERLPERFRRPVVLCYLEGMTRDQAADRLRCTEGSVRGRLAKARELLRHRLHRRGIALAFPCVPRAGIPESLVATTLRVATGGMSGPVAALVGAASRGWMLGRLNAATVLLMGVGIAASAFAYRNVTLGPATGDVAATPHVVAAAARPDPSARGGVPGAQIKTPDTGAPIPVEGRVLDLEGRPVAGATVSVQHVQAPPDGRLDAWIDEVKRLGKQPFGLPVIAAPDRGAASFGNTGRNLLRSLLAGLSPRGPRPQFSATTGHDGRFRIDSLPRDGIATASITGPGIETSQIYILTREMPAIHVRDSTIVDSPTIVYYGARFDHVVAPTRPIVGTVRDEDTGAPIPGVHITGRPGISNSLIVTPGVDATTDAQGRFRVVGLPVARGFTHFTEAPAGQPYVNGGFTSPAAASRPGPLTFDITLRRGVLVSGRLTDKITGRPLRGSVTYRAFRDNPHLDKYPNFKRGSQETRILIPGDDGRFTIPALPGRGLIAARVPEEGYLHGLGADAIKGFDKALGAFITYPLICSAADQHVFAEINPGPERKDIDLELQADPGRTVTGTIVDPGGRALDGWVEILTLDVFQSPQHVPANSPRFVVKGIPSGPHRLDFFHRGRKLAGSLALKGDEKGDLVAKLQPWGTLTGRVVDEEGKPRADVEIFSTIRERPDPERGDLRDKPIVDAQGRFRIQGLVPGVRYNAYGSSAGGTACAPILNGVRVGPGEIKDLGDITLPTTKKDGN
jgi:RNA polymerase sigma factor (sigma-70 family)